MENKGKITFTNYKVKNVVFTLNEDFTGENVKIEFSASHQLKCDATNSSMIVLLKIEVFKDQTGNKNYPFSMEVEVEGLFSLRDMDKNEDVSAYKANALAILFPYARSIISTYTAAANVAPLILPTVNILKMLDAEE